MKKVRNILIEYVSDIYTHVRILLKSKKKYCHNRVFSAEITSLEIVVRVKMEPFHFQEATAEKKKSRRQQECQNLAVRTPAPYIMIPPISRELHRKKGGTCGKY